MFFSIRSEFLYLVVLLAFVARVVKLMKLFFLICKCFFLFVVNVLFSCVVSICSACCKIDEVVFFNLQVLFSICSECLI